jgi:hypothetical protein
MARPMTVDTVGNAVPPLDPELAGLLDDLADIHPGIDLILDGVRLIALDRLDADDRRRPTDMTQLLAVTLAGSPDGTDVLTLIGLLVARITNADSNPALRGLSVEAQKNTQRHGENLLRHLADPDLHQHASNASGAIHTD